MCPVCIATAAWVAAGAGSGGGAAVLLVTRKTLLRRKVPQQGAQPQTRFPARAKARAAVSGPTGA